MLWYVMLYHCIVYDITLMPIIEWYIMYTHRYAWIQTRLGRCIHKAEETLPAGQEDREWIDDGVPLVQFVYSSYFIIHSSGLRCPSGDFRLGSKKYQQNN